MTLDEVSGTLAVKTWSLVSGPLQRPDYLLALFPLFTLLHGFSARGSHCADGG
eukprot:CAMPEP_0114424788 /NCGR_PEP_ID=MMETSP0103-20121206/6879_1 /TAXON_ID=37642 ORGANISM="Paraphysomonas imperforata, Strain PA2" /NCGR_SAMPLE_ID=MMETSP0103 /ASSEMBLY_ACC=CAM_ASM_000201 /LENGTH=52 /DNA_ID=CAMNT_0001593561 /DNA_START=451 /DNA_END=612 /DNA_ORIENTATION=-